MGDEYKIRDIDLNKLANWISEEGQLTELAALHLLDTIRVMREQNLALTVRLAHADQKNTFDATRLRRLANLVDASHPGDDDDSVLACAGTVIGSICYRVEQLIKRRDELMALINEASEYLDTNRLTNIAHGSILHQKLREVK